MHTAIQAFFFVQVALEHAANKIADVSHSILSELVTTPAQRSLTRLMGTIEREDIKDLRSAIDGIRTEVQTLRQDIRELQRSTTV